MLDSITPLADPAAKDRDPVLDAIHRRRAWRCFTGARLDRTTIQTLLDAAVHAPTAMHQEPWAFVVVQDADRLRRLSDRAKERLAERGVSPAISPLLRPEADIFYGAGNLVVICARPGPFVEADCWLAAQNLMLAAHALGLGTCVIGLANAALADADVKRDLGLPGDVEAFAAIIVGVPDGETPVSPRKPPHVLAWHA